MLHKNAPATIIATALLLFFSFGLFAQNADSSFTETNIELQTSTGKISGTLTIPKTFNKISVALIIAGSGPTDRNGNSMFLKSDAYKKLAQQLALHNIAAVRYDKRGVALSMSAAKSENDLRFDDYVNDAKDWINLLKQDKRFTTVIVIGHSEGSLIGMIAAAEANADKYISIAGAGRPADKIIREQLSSQPDSLRQQTSAIMDTLLQGKTVSNVDPSLNVLFRSSVQPYLISWFKYDPQTEIKKLKIPVLIIQGTSDIQVTENDAKLLAAAKPDAQLAMIENMNHIFRIVNGGREENIATYSNPSLPISQELVDSIADFIEKK